ncbi:hypothetical protein PRIPAC_81617 [Pristionchus pacificus]|uniref:G protein-coupled receptor n=1 Tax=Pristionchus pacificus TaxID=54126 RepID=A0A2A6CK50_PRIPA|nr:hypothetical protein PRIPAC_81617 [Pristionchus pacificus]|eukprot:PDM78572.1 G protein-coupled receptor [Pristionchus pacificus]
MCYRSLVIEGSKNLCFLVYSFMMHGHAHYTILLAFGFCYRFYVIKYDVPSASQLIFALVLVYAPTLIIFSFFAGTPLLDDEALQDIMNQSFLDYNLTSQSRIEMIIGTERSTAINIGIMWTLGMPLPFYIIIIFAALRIRRFLAASLLFSEYNHNMHRDVMKTLLVQALLPTLYLFAAIAHAIDNEVDGEGITFRTHTPMFVLPSPLPTHDVVSIVHHCTVDSIAIVANIILIIAILKSSQSSFCSYKVLLLNSAVVDLTASLAAITPIPIKYFLAYVYIGPCTAVNISTVSLSTLSQSMFLIASSFYYRLHVLKRPSPRTISMLAICLVVSIPNAVTLITYSFTLDDTDKVIEELRKLRPCYQLDGYAIEGHTTIFTFLTIFAIMSLTIPVGPTIIFILVVRRKLLRAIVEKSGKLSAKTIEMHRSLTRVLSIQSLLPVFFSGAVISFVSCQFDLYCSETQEHFMAESASYMPLLAPFVTMYYVRPYREFISSALMKKKIIAVGPVSSRNFTTTL